MWPVLVEMVLIIQRAVIFRVLKKSPYGFVHELHALNMRRRECSGTRMQSFRTSRCLTRENKTPSPQHVQPAKKAAEKPRLLSESLSSMSLGMVFIYHDIEAILTS